LSDGSIAQKLRNLSRSKLRTGTNELICVHCEELTKIPCEYPNQNHEGNGSID
jgi:hypothetical protein